jgi:predicted RNA polymerase sigma factor
VARRLRAQGVDRLRRGKDRRAREESAELKAKIGRLLAVLTRPLGVRRLELVEDVLQAALVQAPETWSPPGAPEAKVQLALALAQGTSKNEQRNVAESQQFFSVRRAVRI